MAYDGDFYEAYEAYLHEDLVRTKHNQMFALWENVAKCRRVIDLGCGQSTEYFWHATAPACYQGFDVNEGDRAIAANYRDPAFVETVHALDWKPDAFVSLFSTECTATALENAELYERLFREIPTIEYALVAGFYYTRRRTTNPVKEAGDIVSWQTNSRIEHDSSDVYDELRITAEVPSTMFGEDVVEVWRILSRCG